MIIILSNDNEMILMNNENNVMIMWIMINIINESNEND